MNVGWIGLGNMGAPMVRNVADLGISVDGYNRTSKEGLDLGNARLLTDLFETVRDKHIVIVMVSDGEAVRDVLFGQDAAKAMQKDTIVVNMSTIGVDETIEIANQLQELGIHYVDAPVVGSVKPATEGTLTIVAGGSEEDFAAVRPIFDALSKISFHIGDVGKGATMKLLVNSFLGLCVEALGETLAYGVANELTAERVVQVLEQSAVWSPMLAAKKSMIVDDDYSAHFALRHLEKDLGLALRQADAVDVSLPAVQTTRTVLNQAMESGHGDSDMIAVIPYLRDQIGRKMK